MGEVQRPGSVRTVAVAVATVFLLAGCQGLQQRYVDPQPMVARAPDSRPVRAIAVVVARYLPDVNLGDLAPRPQGGSGIAQNTGTDAAMGAAAGASLGALAFGLAVAAGGIAACINPAAPATCTAFWSYAAGGALAGGAAGIVLSQKAGASGGAPVNFATVAVRETPLQNILRTIVAARCGALAATVCAETHFPGPEYRGARPDYAPLADAPAEAVLEVEVLDLAMTKSEIAGSHALTMTARARLVRAAGGEVLYRGAHVFSSEPLPMDSWTGSNAEKLREALQRGIEELASAIVGSALAPEGAGPRL